MEIIIAHLGHLQLIILIILVMSGIDILSLSNEYYPSEACKYIESKIVNCAEGLLFKVSGSLEISVLNLSLPLGKFNYIYKISYLSYLIKLILNNISSRNNSISYNIFNPPMPCLKRSKVTAEAAMLKP